MKGYSAPRGMSIIDLLWRELDASQEESSEYLRGLATGLALMLNPYDPHPEQVLKDAELKALLG